MTNQPCAFEADITTADLFVGDFDDESMIRVYATENATQRGNSSTAIAGSVASAIRFLAKSLMVCKIVPEISETIDSYGRSHLRHDIERGHLESDRGIGWRLILKFLDGIHGINEAGMVAPVLGLIRCIFLANGSHE